MSQKDYLNTIKIIDHYGSVKYEHKTKDTSIKITKKNGQLNNNNQFHVYRIQGGIENKIGTIDKRELSSLINKLKEKGFYLVKGVFVDAEA